MAPASSFHHSTVWKLDDVLRRLFGRRAMVRSQMAFAASPRSRPEPDVAVVPTGDYDAVDPDQAWLIVEVADSSLRFDRTVKSELYASAGVPEYWIVDPDERSVLVLALEGKSYVEAVSLRVKGVVRSPLFRSLKVSLDDLFAEL